jgi:hypothetical protein
MMTVENRQSSSGFGLPCGWNLARLVGLVRIAVIHQNQHGLNAEPSMTEPAK